MAAGRVQPSSRMTYHTTWTRSVLLQREGAYGWRRFNPVPLGALASVAER